MKILYLRVDWSDIEKESGVYDWSSINDIMNRYGALGFKFSFRFCTYEGMAHDVPYATTKWVFDSGAEFYEHSLKKSGIRNMYFETHIDESFEPIYNDPIYLKYLERFVAECARKLDNDLRVECIDIGTFGTLGEAHTGLGFTRTIYL